MNDKKRFTAPSRRQVQWKIREDCLQELAKEAERTGFSTMPSLLNHILFQRYFNKKEE